MTIRPFLFSNRWNILVVMLVSLLLAPWAHAESAASVYDIPLICQTQKEGERHALFEQGFFQILGRLSTDANIIHQPQVKAALKQVEKYVEQYSYTGNTLMVRYNSAMLAQLLGQSGSPSWTAQRPEVVLWLAMEENNDRHLVGAESDPQVHETLKKLALEQGLPLVLPLMDLEDVSLVTVTDVWGQFTEVLSKASQRYNAKTMLVGRLKREGDVWHSDWTLRYADLPASWHTEGRSLEAVMAKAVEKTAEHLRQKLAVNTDPKQIAGKPLLIGIQGIRSSTDYRKVEYYLTHLNGIKQAEIKQVAGNTALFEVIPYGTQGKSVFAQLLNSDQRLLATAIPHQSVAQADLVYEWEP